ncbi:MAG: hypothetical protein JSR49_08965 [Proteobacteria bacterium]|nr:hypothetical protein [Pseudomonadota bacterium]
MPVPVVDVGVMRVAVGDRRMCVLMRMRLAAIAREIVRVLVVHVVHVAVRVGNGLVHVRVLVALGQVQSYPGGHERRCQPDKTYDTREFIAAEPVASAASRFMWHATTRAKSAVRWVGAPCHAPSRLRDTMHRNPCSPLG